MGIKKATNLFSRGCVVESHLDHLRKTIITEKGESLSYKPTIMIDGNAWIIAALCNPQLDSKISAQFHAQPMVPVTEAAEYITKRINLLKKHKYIPIFCIDGQRYPLKREENEARQGTDSDGDNMDDYYTHLYEAYTFFEDYSIDEVFQLRKKTMYPREDVYAEVKDELERLGIHCISGAFEADSQFVAMQNQGIIDVAISKDTDLVGMGIVYTIKRLNLSNGNISYMCWKKLMKEVIPSNCIVGWEDRPHTLEVHRAASNITQHDLSFFCLMLGTDHLRKGLPGSGGKDCCERMNEYLLKTEEEKRGYINTYALDHPNSTEFIHAYFSWTHAPAFIVAPNDSTVSAKDAFFSEGQDYSIMLGSMTATTNNMPDFYHCDRNGKLGFMPHNELTHGHPQTEEEEDQFIFFDFFTLAAWARTGRPLSKVPLQRNRSGEIVVPGAIISFETIRIKHQSSRSLRLWLSARGVPNTDIKDRKELEDMVRFIHYIAQTDALPKFVLRGGGGYVTNAVFVPQNGNNVTWLHGEDAITAIRSDALATFETTEVIEQFFENQFNSKRKRCLSHLKSGSVDIQEIKVTTNLISDLMPERSFFVIQCLCAPSMKGLGSKRKLYLLRLAFLIEDGRPNTLMPAPFSIDDCPVGVGPCAHKGCLVLLLYSIRHCLKDKTYAEIVNRMPANIHSVANQCHLVHHLYPAPYSHEYGIQRDIKRNVKEDAQKKRDEEEGVADDLTLEVINEDEREGGIPTIDICREVGEWCDEINANFDEHGAAHLSDPRLSQKACEKYAKPNTNAAYKERFNIRAKNEKEAVDKGQSPATMYGLYCEHLVQNAIKNAWIIQTTLFILQVLRSKILG